MGFLMGRGCLKTVGLLLLVVVVAIIAAFGTMYAAQLGLLPGFNANYQNRATVVLDSVQQMSVLTTTRYNFSGLVTSEREMPPLLAALYGERQVLVAVGHITAGIDLSQLGEDDIVISGNALAITLPPPTLQDCFLDESASYVASRDTGIFSRSAPDLEGQARQYAIQQFRTQAAESNILDEVQRQSQVAIGQFIQALSIPGVTQITIVNTPPLPDAPLPQSCQ